MRKLTVISFMTLLITSSASYADTAFTPGFYAGIQGGESDTHYTNSEVFNPINGYSQFVNIPFFPGLIGTSTSSSTPLANQQVNSSGLGGRLFAGYQFTPYCAVEAGYTQYNKTDFSASNTQNFNVNGQDVETNPVNVNGFVSNQFTGEITEHSIDLVGKGILPIGQYVNAYAKAGFAYIEENRTITQASEDTQVDTINGSVITNISNDVIVNQTFQAVRPTYGVGISVDATPKIPVDISWTRVQGAGSISNADLLALGVGYRFG